MFVWNEAKRVSNLTKHGLDFADAGLIYNNPAKRTYVSDRKNEKRWLDVAVARVHGCLLALVYTHRGEDVRIISFRPASREEREQYDKDREQD